MYLFVRFYHYKGFFLSLDFDNVDNVDNDNVDCLEEIHKLDNFYFLFKFLLSSILLDCIDINACDCLCGVTQLCNSVVLKLDR